MLQNKMLQFFPQWLDLHFGISQTLYPRQDPANAHYFPGQIADLQPASIPELQCCRNEVNMQIRHMY
jgi:hypothetical protein